MPERLRRVLPPPRALPQVTRAEWDRIAAAIDELPAPTAESIKERIRQSASLTRPYVCPMLETPSGACLIYEARPVACRAYGFYSERHEVLGCSRIEAIADTSPGVVWGNHTGLQHHMAAIGPSAPISDWLEPERVPG